MTALHKLAEGIFIVAPEAPPAYPYGNCMYIDDERPTIIDLGAGGRAFATLPCDKVQIALISHSHFDHIHGDAYFPQAAKYVGREESATFSDEQAYINFHGYYLWNNFLPGIKRESLGGVVPLPSDVPVQPGFRFIPLSGTFQDMQTFDLGRITITAVHLPGHTCGHYGFWLEKEGILFSADIDLVPAGPWYSNNTADVGDLIRSVDRIKALHPHIIVPSHRRMQSENLNIKLDRYIQVVIDRESRIYDLLKNPQGVIELSSHKLVFPDPANTYQVFWERMTIFIHIKHLIKQNKVQENEPDIYQWC